MKDAINQAVKDGKITQDEADWLLQGLEKGYLPGRWGRGGFGHGMRGLGLKNSPTTTPSRLMPRTSTGTGTAL
ncbi:MAG: hypothetical protein ACP5TV_12420, partial [Anaerolineae bacterium]